MRLISKEWMDAYHAYVLRSLAGKQPTLVSGTNIKTLNGQSLLGEGNINFLQLVAANSLPQAGEQYLNKVYLVPSRDPDEATHNIKEEWVVVTGQNTIVNAIEVIQEDAQPSELSGNEGVQLANENGVHGYYNIEYGEIVGSLIPLKVGDVINDSINSVHYTLSSNGWSGEISGRVTDPTTTYEWEIIGSTQIDLNNYYSKSEIDAMLHGATLNIDKLNGVDRLVVTKENKSYFTQLTELSKPGTPTIASGQQTKIVVVGSSITDPKVSVSKVSGSILMYKIGSDNWQTAANASVSDFTVPSGFTNDGTAAEHTVAVRVKCVLNGVESDPSQSIDITIKPKIAPVTFDSLSGSEYDKVRTIKAHPTSTSGGINSYYKVGSGSNVTIDSYEKTITITAETYNQTFNLTGTVDAKTGWVSAESASASVKVNTPKIYWAVVDSLPTTNAGVEALTNALSQKSFPTVTLPNSGVQGKYLVMAYNKATVGNKDVTSVKDQNQLSQTFHIETAGDFRLCVIDNLAASAAGLKYTFA